MMSLPFLHLVVNLKRTRKLCCRFIRFTIPKNMITSDCRKGWGSIFYSSFRHALDSLPKNGSRFRFSSVVVFRPLKGQVQRRQSDAGNNCVVDSRDSVSGQNISTWAVPHLFLCVRIPSISNDIPPSCFPQTIQYVLNIHKHNLNILASKPIITRKTCIFFFPSKFSVFFISYLKTANLPSVTEIQLLSIVRGTNTARTHRRIRMDE